MRGLDPRTHANVGPPASVTRAWMAGSGPAMTASGLHKACRAPGCVAMRISPD